LNIWINLYYSTIIQNEEHTEEEIVESIKNQDNHWLDENGNGCAIVWKYLNRSNKGKNFNNNGNNLTNIDFVKEDEIDKDKKNEFNIKYNLLFCIGSCNSNNNK